MKDVEFMKLAILEANKCVPIESAFNVGAVLIKDDRIIATGFSRELPGNTHAEQVCLMKCNSEDAKDSTIYSTMEPCGLRLSGNIPCANLIIDAGIKRVVQGIKEPETFVGESKGRKMLLDAGIQVDTLPQFQAECLAPNSHLLK